MTGKRVWMLLAMMAIGEIIFILPFLITRVFRPTFLTVFDINNLQLGSAFSLYGIVAMISYFAGGPLADRFSPRILLTVSLLVTAVGGIFMWFIPSIWVLTILYGFWGMTTILLFWAGYVKAQREIGGSLAQGKTFGAIDAGRGLFAAILASASVFMLGAFLPLQVEDAAPEQLTQALQQVILTFTIITALGAVIAWFALKDETFEQDKMPSISLTGIKMAVQKPAVWLQALIILCSYVGYKCTDDFSLYASDAFGYDDVKAAHVGTISFWVRPVAAVAAGFLGDRFIHSKIVMACFAVMITGGTVIATGVLNTQLFVLIMVTIATVSVGIYGLRGLYFALFQEYKLPLIITGSAAGFVSVIGYTPDVFFGPLMGVILDQNPGEIGHQYLFGVMVGFSLVGLLATYLFRKVT